MDMLDKYLQILPQFLQTPISALVIIIFGYFVAKIFMIVAATILGVMPLNEIETPTQSMYFIRLLFWTVWLIFIIVGLVKFPVVRGVFSNIYPSEVNLWVYFAILFGAGMLSLLSALLKLHIKEILKPVLKVPIIKNTLFLALSGWGMFIVVLIVASTSLGTPDTVQERIVASLLLLGMGWMLGHMVKEAVFNLLSIFDFTYSPKDIDLSISISIFGRHRIKKLSSPKHIYFGYIVFMLFVVAAIKLLVRF